jgi:hypothetical protein
MQGVATMHGPDDTGDVTLRKAAQQQDDTTRKKD